MYDFSRRETSDVQLGPAHFLDLGTCRLAYREVGQGEPLLLVHGYPLHGMTFRHLVGHFASQYRCIVPDLPGLGETVWTEKTDFNFAGQAATLRRLVDHLGLKRYAVVAHDTGATIARRLVTTDLVRVSGLVMIGTEIPDHRPPWIPFFQRTSNPRRTGPFKRFMSRRWFRHSSAAFGGCFHDRTLIDGEFHDLFVAPLLASDERIRGQIHYLRGIDWTIVDGMRAEHARITIPTLLIWGADDPVFPVRYAREMARQLPDCRGFATIANQALRARGASGRGCPLGSRLPRGDVVASSGDPNAGALASVHNRRSIGEQPILTTCHDAQMKCECYDHR